MRSRVQSVVRVGSSLLPYSVCAAVVAGLGEAFVFHGRRLLGSRLAFVGPEHLWLAPLGYLAVFAATLAGCLLLGFLWRRVHVERLFLFATGFLGMIGLLRALSLVRLHPVAEIGLAAGLAYQLSRTSIARVASRRLRHASVVAGAVLLLVVCTTLWPPGGGAREWLTPARQRPALPNIVLLIWDSVRELNVSLYGYSRPTTPLLERWAARGVVFDRAFATSPWTLPSHASFFTGRFPHELSADWESPLDQAWPTLAEVLRDRGYRTGGFVANPYYLTVETGISRGFDRWENYRLSLDEALLSAGAVQWLIRWRPGTILRRRDPMRAPEVTEAFLDWVEVDARPFFAFLNYFDAHAPYRAPPELVKRFALPARRMMGRYDASIAQLDLELDRLLRALETRGLLDQTIVVVTSDHGEQFGSHDLLEHANSLYREAIQVPLVLIAPHRVPEGLRVHHPVTLRNLPATLLDLAGITGRPLPGRSHARFWTGTPADSQDVPVLATLTPSPRAPQAYRNARGEIRSLVHGRYHYILNADGTDELFDVTADPLERRDLVSRSQLPLITVLWTRIRAIDSIFPRKMRGGTVRR